MKITFKGVTIMNKYIAYCGLDCETCEAREATITNDDELRAKVAKEWSELIPIIFNVCNIRKQDDGYTDKPDGVF